MRKSSFVFKYNFSSSLCEEKRRKRDTYEENVKMKLNVRYFANDKLVIDRVVHYHINSVMSTSYLVTLFA